MVVLWLGLSAFLAKGLCSITGWGTKIPQAAQGEGEESVWVLAFSSFKGNSNIESFPFPCGFFFFLYLLYFFQFLLICC